MYKDTV